MKAMLLAAGLGTRMAPLTAHHPKPALPVLGEPMLSYLVRQLAAQGVESVVVNTHVFPEQLADCVAGASIPVTLSPEPRLLGSAGGIFAARDHLTGPDPFVVINADMRLEFDLAELQSTHERGASLATLLLRDDARKSAFGTIGFTSGNAMCRITERIRIADEVGCGLFTGVQMMSPEIFEHFPSGGPADLMPDVYMPLLAKGARLQVAMQPSAQEWWPLGTPAELLDANLRVLRETQSVECHIDPTAQVRGKLDGPVRIGARVSVPESCELGPNVVIGDDVTLSPDSALCDAVVLSGAQVPPRTRLQRGIAFGRKVWRDA